ncbi:NAD(P)/FAD-dependent oxidoreductase [Sphaerisporangium sp. NPDC051011]|uniref:NAD(P)/FAD-dependent oxidoreductase n=1 Tax=Sphaerisporangium sp. NPDC051011 TaxID=3155792 RepID=UPI0033E1AA81
MSAPRPMVVIIGAGFAGLAAAKALHRAPVQVTMVDQHDYHTFTPFLYQVATALLEADDVAYPVRGEVRRLGNVSFRLATVTGVDLDTKAVDTDQGRLPYDYLVLAAGAVNAYFGHSEIAEHSLGLNDLPEALQLRNAILARFEAAAWTGDPAERARLLSFAVVGGGPTGTEFAGALAELVTGTLTRDFPGLDRSEVSITLAEAGRHPLSVFPRPLPAAVDRALRRKGVRIRSGVMVTEVDKTGLRLKDGTTVPAATVVWAAGVRSSHLADGLGLRLGSHERIVVTPTLQVDGHPEVFAVGDFAEIPQPDAGEPLPMLAQVAIQSGRQAARNIGALLRGDIPQPFRYKDLGTMATVGRGFAVADIGPVRLSGQPGFLAWLVVHIARIAGMRNRWLVLANWVSGYLFRNRPVRLIVGPRGADQGQLQDQA